jgi:hypothetical protein
MIRRTCWSLRWLPWLSLLFASAARAASDADVWALIDTLKPVAEAITVDGHPGDWDSIPAFSDPSGDAGSDPSRDITSVRIAPTANALVVLIQTAGPPATASFSFWIRFDFMGEQHDDVELALDPNGADTLFHAPEDGCTAPPPDYCSLSWEHATIAIGSAVEVRIPYADLDAALPASMQGKLMGAGARSTVRVRPHTIDYPPPSYFYTEIDDGAAVGSFRLVTTPYALDPPLPPGGDAYTALPNPLPGLWYVGQGAFTHGTHSGYWGYDLHRTDGALRPESPPGSTSLTDNFSFGQPILAPVAGTVYSLVNDEPDHPPYDYSPAGPPNFLFLEIPGNLGLLFSHTQQGTIPFAPGSAVAAGASIGRVGHSGAVGWPHLHYGAEEIDNSFASHPLGITNANVGLNPTMSDPWRRTIASWGIREGFFVLPEPGVEAAFAASVAMLAALAQRRRRRAASSAPPAASPSAPAGSGRSTPSKVPALANASSR